MQKKLREELLKTASRWLVCFLVIGGFMFYHSTAPLVTIGIAGIATLIAMAGMTYFKVSRQAHD